MTLHLGPGDRYEQFEILEELGTGTFATVYRARSVEYPGQVALKLSRTAIESEATALRALREIRILESLTNPHVVRIYDHGMGGDDRWYMVMEVLEGADLLKVHWFHEPMETVRACRLVYEACVGLEEAHQQGIVHRDIKPENLWITPDGTCKVIDFGLARAWDPGSTFGLTATTGHMLIGTPHYSQPEQVLGTELVPASDVYSLGIVLYELLSARMPLFAKEPCNAIRERLLDEPLEWLSAHVKRDVVPLDRYREVRKQLPKRLIQLVHWMLQKPPEQRPTSAGVVARTLASILHRELDTRVAAALHIHDARGTKDVQFILPGKQSLGTSKACVVQTASDGSNRVQAMLHWGGRGTEAVLAPVEPFDGVWVEKTIVDQPVRLPAGTTIRAGQLSMKIEYP